MIAFLIILPLILTCVLLIFYVERKFASFTQDRLGPMVTGVYGTLQPVADLLKLLQKEDIIPTKADGFLFKIAPIVVFLAVLTGFTVIPLGIGFTGIAIETGVFFLMAIVSIDIIGLLMAGWSSNNKYALFGAMRAVAQIISYEIPLGLSILTVVILTQTLDLQEISVQQSSIDQVWGGGIMAWNIVKAPFLFLSFIVFFIATLAECNRAPFDIPEAESELVAGFHVEYSGFRFAIFFLAEYAMMFLVSLLGAILFWGSWNSPLPNLGQVKLYDWTMGESGTVLGYFWGGFWLVMKAFINMILQVWVRWTFPRLRLDQLMSMCWKVLTPFALLLVLISCIWKLLIVS